MNLAMFPCIIEFFFETNSACFWVLNERFFFQLATVDSMFFGIQRKMLHHLISESSSSCWAKVKQLRLQLPIEIFLFRREHGGHENQNGRFKTQRKHWEFPSKDSSLFRLGKQKSSPTKDMVGRYRMTSSSPQICFQWSFLTTLPPHFVLLLPLPVRTLVTFSPVEMEPRRVLKSWSWENSQKTIGYSPAPPKRCQYDPKGWLMGTPYHSFSTP